MPLPDFPRLTQQINSQLAPLRAGQPDTLKGFGALAKAAMAEGALDAKTKELIALAIGVAQRCDGCIGLHAKALVQLGTSEQELQEMLGVAVLMGGGPSLMFAANALAAFQQFEQAKAA
ncbi:MAG: carboxymuconolactone decarboxylase family protein [Stenotrophomonas sp.]